MSRVRVANHGEERARLVLAVDDPIGVENFVAAVLGIDHRKHHQFHIGRVAAGKGVQRIVNFLVRESQTHLAVGIHERTPPLGLHRDMD